MNMVQFSLTAAEVNVIDTTATFKTLKTLLTNTNIARVPVRLEITKEAGTAYTVGAGCRIQIKDNNGAVLFDFPAAGFLDQATAEGRVVMGSTAGKAFKDGGATSFVMSATASLASGTGAVKGRLYFDEFQVVF